MHGLGAEFELPGLNLGEVEHLVDEAEQTGSGAMHALKRSCAFSLPNLAALVTIISVSRMMTLSEYAAHGSRWIRTATLCSIALPSATRRLGAHECERIITPAQPRNGGDR